MCKHSHPFLEDAAGNIIIGGYAAELPDVSHERLWPKRATYTNRGTHHLVSYQKFVITWTKYRKSKRPRRREKRYLSQIDKKFAF